MELNTGVSTQNGEKINLGDILSGPNIHEVVVVKDEEGNLFAEVISEPFIAFELEEFIKMYSQLKIKGSVLTRSGKKIFE